MTGKFFAMLAKNELIYIMKAKIFKSIPKV